MWSDELLRVTYNCDTIEDHRQNDGVAVDAAVGAIKMMISNHWTLRNAVIGKLILIIIIVNRFNNISNRIIKNRILVPLDLNIILGPLTYRLL